MKQPKEMEGCTCDWFALCKNPAVKTRSHPILGEVLICQRCDDKIKRIDEATSKR